MRVTANAEAVLRRMRLPDQLRVLWIDSICINQEDKQERSQQVALMHEIYGHGMRNLIWLGDDDGATKRALLSIDSLLDEMEDYLVILA